MQDTIKSVLLESAAVKQRLAADHVASIVSMGAVLLECFRGSGKLLVCGNGGSAADSQHIVAELVHQFQRHRRALPAISLTTNSSVITALANDWSYEDVFSRQVEALGKPGDVLLAISTSGKSPSVIKAVDRAHKIGMRTLGLTGKDGGILLTKADYSVVVPSLDTDRIQEAHTCIIHVLSRLVEEGLFVDAAMKK